MDDKQLSAWVDGELAGPAHAAEREQLEAWLLEHPQDAARARQWAADAAALRARLAPLADEAVPPHLQRLVWRRSGVPAWALAASAAGLLLLGGLMGAALMWQADQRAAVLEARVSNPVNPPNPPNSAAGWVQRAAYAHSVYTIEPRHAVEVGAQEEHLARWLTRRIELPVKLFNLQDQGFHLVGGRLLPDGAGKSAQLMYENAARQRVTVYLRKPDVGTEAAFRYEQQGELGLFYWVESGLGYALVGALPRSSLLTLAEDIYRQNPAAPTTQAAAAAAAVSAASAASAR